MEVFPYAHEALRNVVSSAFKDTLNEVIKIQHFAYSDGEKHLPLTTKEIGQFNKASQSPYGWPLNSLCQYL